MAAKCDTLFTKKDVLRAQVDICSRAPLSFPSQPAEAQNLRSSPLVTPLNSFGTHDAPLAAHILQLWPQSPPVFCDLTYGNQGDHHNLRWTFANYRGLSEFMILFLLSLSKYKVTIVTIIYRARWNISVTLSTGDVRVGEYWVKFVMVEVKVNGGWSLREGQSSQESAFHVNSLLHSLES